MKRYSFMFTAAAVILALGIGLTFMTSCEGPAGDNAAETCTQCHNDESLVLAKITQASNSQHQMGSTFERNDTDCAACHTHQGFLETQRTGEMETATAISNPVPTNCRTCHMIHENYDTTDFALRGANPVDVWINGETIDLGSGNVCVNCHQPRIPNPMPAVGGSNVSITSPYWGPHHGTQSTMMWGTAGYEIAGAQSYPSSGTHAHTSAGCNTCHMAEPFGAKSGGHTFRMSYEFHGENEPNIAGCQGCHTSIEDFDLNGVMTEVEDLTTQLKTLLVNAGYLNPETGRPNVNFGSSLDLTADQAGALYNYKFVTEDKSKGVHNPAYAKALLQNSIDHLSN